MNKKIEEQVEKTGGQVELKDAWSTLYHLRDFEVKHLWQKALFLVPMLIVLVSGYGYLFVQLLEGGEKDTSTLHLVCCALSCLGLIFSVVWIMMAKGSKAWYEVYENIIRKVEGNIAPPEYCPTKNYKLVSARMDKNILSSNAGKFSSSRLNIVIGQVLGGLFFLACIGHMLTLFIGTSYLSLWIQQHPQCIALIVFFSTIAIIRHISRKAESTALEYDSEDKENKSESRGLGDDNKRRNRIHISLIIR